MKYLIEERRLIDESVKNEKAGKLVSLEELENVRCKMVTEIDV